MSTSKAERKLEKELETQLEKSITAYFENSFLSNIQESPQLKIIGELVGYAIFLIFIFLVFPKLQFVTAEYSVYQPIAFWLTTFGLVLSILKHLTPSHSLSHLLESGDNLVSGYSTYMLLVIYPLDFAAVNLPAMQNYFRYFLYFVLVAVSIAMVFNFVQVFLPVSSKPQRTSK